MSVMLVGILGRTYNQVGCLRFSLWVVLLVRTFAGDSLDSVELFSTTLGIC